MPTEFRRITFNQNELREAINEFDSRNKKMSPKGDISIVRSKRHNGQNGYEIETFDIQKQKASQFFIDEDNALEMLIQSCLQTHVSLPKIARKLVREIDSSLCLDLITE